MKIKTRLICNRLKDNFVVEAEELLPGRRTIKINQKAYYLPLPYVQNLKVKTYYPNGSFSMEVYSFCSHKPAQTFDDLCHIPLPNIFCNGAVCQKNKNVNDFWSTEFNFSLVDNVTVFMRKNFNEFKNSIRISAKQLDGFFAWWELQENTNNFNFEKIKQSIVQDLKVFE